MNYLSERIADLYIKRNIILQDEKDVYKKGIELILNDIITFSFILLISSVIWRFSYGAEFLITFCITRVFCGGYHAKKAYICKITMVFTFLSIVILSGILKDTDNTILYGILIISFASLLPFIPVKHPNKKLNAEKMRKNKIRGIISYVFFSICSVIIINFLNKIDGLIILLSLSAVTVLAIIGTFTNRKEV